MIYLLIDSDAWYSAHDDPIARPGPEGFVHCCDDRQRASVRANYFPEGAEIVSLGLDPTLLAHDTRYEAGSGGEGERFPHVYGPVSRSEVLDVSAL